jgi:hypothetical protein
VLLADPLEHRAHVLLFHFRHGALDLEAAEAAQLDDRLDVEGDVEDEVLLGLVADVLDLALADGAEPLVREGVPVSVADELVEGLLAERAPEPRLDDPRGDVPLPEPLQVGAGGELLGGPLLLFAHDGGWNGDAHAAAPPFLLLHGDLQA